jgi:hypothetical protein
MIPDITRYLNKIILVSIPALFEDGRSRYYKLIGAELNGLWLQSDELTQRLLPDGSQDLVSLAPVVFVPFAQIAGVLVTSGTPAPALQAKPQGAATVPTPAAPGRGEPSSSAVGARQSKKK